jgi:hypothetical protein
MKPYTHTHVPHAHAPRQGQERVGLTLGASLQLLLSLQLAQMLTLILQLASTHSCCCGHHGTTAGLLLLLLLLLLPPVYARMCVLVFWCVCVIFCFLYLYFCVCLYFGVRVCVCVCVCVCEQLLGSSAYQTFYNYFIMQLQ